MRMGPNHTKPKSPPPKQAVQLKKALPVVSTLSLPYGITPSLSSHNHNSTPPPLTHYTHVF
jgi:hypothetical protein